MILYELIDSYLFFFYGTEMLNIVEKKEKLKLFAPWVYWMGKIFSFLKQSNSGNNYISPKTLDWVQTSWQWLESHHPFIQYGTAAGEIIF